MRILVICFFACTEGTKLGVKQKDYEFTAESITFEINNEFYSCFYRGWIWFIAALPDWPVAPEEQRFIALGHLHRQRLRLRYFCPYPLALFI
jgi:hypothetical protein